MRGTVKVKGGCKDPAPRKHDGLFQAVLLYGNAMSLGSEHQNASMAKILVLQSVAFYAISYILFAS
jgi:hypothetical protein